MRIILTISAIFSLQLLLLLSLGLFGLFYKFWSVFVVPMLKADVFFS